MIAAPVESTGNAEEPAALVAAGLRNLARQRKRKNKRKHNGNLRVINVIVDLATLRDGQLHVGGRCEIPGVGPVSATWVRSIVAESSLRLVVVDGITVAAVCHVGKRVPVDLLDAFNLRDAFGAEPPPGGDVTANGAGRSDKKVSYVVTVVIDRALLAVPSSEQRAVVVPGVGPIDLAHAVRRLSLVGVDLLVRRSTALDDIVTGSRYPPAKLVTALLVSGRECDEAGCYNRGDLEIDHTIEHSRGGLTCWRNNTFKCSTHHREKTATYNRNRKVVREPDRSLTCK